MPRIQELPLFPLNTVLFPGMPLPLHIFEERYKLLINQSVKQADPFGIVLIREGSEVGEMAVPHHVGTSAFVTHVERLPGGRMNINTVGYQRFRIRELRYDKPYLVGLVEDYPLDDASGSVSASTIKVLRARLHRYLIALVDVLDMEYDFDNIPDDPVALAYFTAIVLNTPSDEKQDLLTIPSLQKLVNAELSLLSRETGLLSFMASQEMRSESEDAPSPFSQN